MWTSMAVGSRGFFITTLEARICGTTRRLTKRLVSDPRLNQSHYCSQSVIPQRVAELFRPHSAPFRACKNQFLARTKPARACARQSLTRTKLGRTPARPFLACTTPRQRRLDRFLAPRGRPLACAIWSRACKKVLSARADEFLAGAKACRTRTGMVSGAESAKPRPWHRRLGHSHPPLPSGRRWRKSFGSYRTV